MLSTTEQVAAFYSNIIHDPQLLANGYDLIKEYLFASQQNRKNTLVNMLNPQVPILTLILNIYPQEIFNSQLISEQQKNETIHYLINLLTTEVLKKGNCFNQKIISQLFSFMHKIHNIEGFKDYVVTYEQALQRLVQNQSDKFGYLVLGLLREADDRVNQFSRHVLGLVVGSEWIPNPQQQLEIIYYCYKSLAILKDTDPEVIDKYVSPFIETTVKYVMGHMKLSVRTIKFSLKILTLLFGDYEIDCRAQIVRQIQSVTAAVITEYLHYLNKGSNFQSGGDLQIADEEDGDPIEVALFQLMQLYMTLYGNDVRTNHELVIYLCIISTFLGQGHYRQYLSKSDQYLMEIQDEGNNNIRNKSIFFIGQMLENEKEREVCKKMLSKYIKSVLSSNPNQLESKITTFAQSYNLSPIILNLPQIYVESALFILYSFTEELFQNKDKICVILANQINASSPIAIDAILATVILNKIINLPSKNGKESQKRQYLGFLRTQVYKFIDNIGMLIAIARGLYSLTPIEELLITAQTNTNIPLVLVQTLVAYLLRSDSSQNQTGYIVLQFFVHLCKCEGNKQILAQLLMHENQLQLLKLYLHDGIAAPIVIDLVSLLANPATIQTIYSQIEHGFAVDQNLSSLISKCLLNHKFMLSEYQILHLCHVYSKKMDIITDIVAAFLESAVLTNGQLIAVLNSNVNSRWLPDLLRQNRVTDLYANFMSSVLKIANEITSQHDLECELIVPYTILLRNMTEAVSILLQQGIFQVFITKLYSYAKLFKGTHLKIVTGHVFIQLAMLRHDLIPQVLQLLQVYGKIESDEWEDEQGEEMQDKIMNKLFMNITNDEVESSFKKIFGELSWDSNLLLNKLNVLKTIL